MINQIINALDKADNAYYNSGKALMSDADYDKLKEKLLKLSPGHPRLSKVGSKVEAHRSEVKLLMHMGSQNKASTDEEFFTWYNKIGGTVSISDKQDGSSMEIVYENGKLNRVSSRGDGTIGLDITQNAMLWSNLPKTVDVDGQLIVRAEAYMKISVWKANFPGTDNPRNIANGIVSRKTDNEKDNRLIIIAAFDIVHPTDEYISQFEKYYALRKLGFDVVRNFTASTVDGIKKIREQYVEERSNLNFEIDGMVVAYNDLAMQEKLGYSDNGTRPNGQIAWKFETAKGKTIVKGMTITMGSTGAIIPTIELEPIFVGGITISNVLQNNFDYIKDLDLNIGDEIEVERAGDVIPHVNKVITKHSIGPYPCPTHCFICNSPLEKVKLVDGEEGRAIICVNIACPGRKVELIRNWIKKTGIKYAGDEVLTALTNGNNAIVNRISDLYKLTIDQLKDLNIGNGVLGKSNATKIMMEIEKTRIIDIDLFIGSLGIKFLGRAMAKHIGYGTAQEFIDADVDDLATKDNMGANKARDMKDSINKFKDIIIELQTYVKINQVQKKVINQNAKYANVTMCFTGIRPTDAERDQMEKVGIIEKSSVSKGLTYLVQKSKDSTSGKTEKALSYGTKILGYNEFQEMIKD